ncbi:MAG: L,D-transpeptidase [Anaerolineaceae bacterium]|nr:L,D-transpeptidase [Anaerolineaceae bacterium]
MPQDAHQQALEALQTAQQALKSGDRRIARQFAARASQLAPEMEAPWLILAALAGPEASLEYLKHALEANPRSQRARQGIHWALQRQRATRQAATTRPVPVPPPVPTQKVQVTRQVRAYRDTSPVRTRPIRRPAPRPAPRRKPASPRYLTPVIVFISTVALILCASLLAWVAFSNDWTVVAQSISAAQPVWIEEPTSLPSSTSTLTPIPVASATALPTDTPLPTLTPTPEPTATPYPTEAPPEVPVEVIVEPPPVEPSAGRWIDVDLTNQMVYAYEGELVVNSFLVSTGTWEYPTVTGQYQIYVKYDAADMSGPGYYLANVPYVMYFYKGYGLHGTYWHNNFGTPMSHGCVNLRTEDAGWLYNWASIGTLVNVHY